MLNTLAKLSEYPFYFQFTLTAYQAGIEQHLPSLQKQIAIMIPCHRVIGKNGMLTGYAGGIAHKKKLLTFEHSSVASLAS